ncbi:MAG: hypothetical protein P8177_06015, partial [Gemmatimonadota bacterium]
PGRAAGVPGRGARHRRRPLPRRTHRLRLPVVQAVWGTHLLPRLAAVLARQGRAGEADTRVEMYAERADRGDAMPPLRPCAGTADRPGGPPAGD